MLKKNNEKVLRHFQMKMPRQERSIKKVDHILNTVIDFADEHGADKVSTSLIAKKAKIPVGTIYQFFGGKNSLIQSAFERSYHRVEMYALENVTSGLELSFNWSEVSARFISAARNEKAFLTISQYINMVSDIDLDPKYSPSKLAHYVCEFIEKYKPELSDVDKMVLAKSLLNISSTFTILALAAQTEELSQRYSKELQLVLERYFKNYDIGS